MDEKKLLSKFKEICSDAVESGNIEGQIPAFLDLVHVMKNEHDKLKRQNENYSVFDNVYCKEPESNTKYDKTLPENEGKIYVFFGKPYSISHKTGEKIEYFCLNYYNVFDTNKDSRRQSPVSDFEDTLLQTFPKAKAIFVYHTKDLKPKDKEKIKYRSYKDILETGKKMFGLEEEMYFKPQISSKENFNSLVSFLDDSTKKIDKCFKYSC